MILSKIINGIVAKSIKGRVDIPVVGIAFDSRKVEPGFLFVCLAGYKADGHEFIQKAVASGATAVLVEKPVQGVPENVTVITVEDSRAALALAAAAYYDNPSAKLKLIGITGTNGKTTTTYLTRSILNKNGEKAGLIGTIQYDFDGEIIESKNTTPESLNLEDMLSRMVLKKLDACVMEVSSHALMMNRVDGLEFDIAVFTNLTLDHMDFHKTFEDYLEAKLRLFKMVGAVNTKNNRKYCIVNADDEYAKFFTDATKVNRLTYGFAKDADLRAVNMVNAASGLSFSIAYGKEFLDIKMKLKGTFNAYNALAAAATGFALNIDREIIKSGLEAVENVPGRFETYSSTSGFTVVVDYAHTPDALTRLLNSVKGLDPKKVICVFGCGGDRDRSKRPIMGKIAAWLADYTIITSDNPRSEDPETIIKEIKSGYDRANNYKAIPDRKEAIYEAVKMAGEGDIVVVAGKGHEDYQLVGKEVLHFSDKETVVEALRAGGLWKE